MSIKVIDNLLTPSYHEALCNIMLGEEFDWYFLPNTTFADRGTDMSFRHMFYSDGAYTASPMAKFISPFIFHLSDAGQVPHVCLLRCKANLTFRATDQSEDMIPHVDYIHPNLSMIYYLHDCDGDTIVYNETVDDFDGNHVPDTDRLTVLDRVQPKANRLIIFNGNKFHTGLLPKESSRRIVINANFNRG